MSRDLKSFKYIARNLHNTIDDEFERIFEELYEMDKEYLYIYLITHKKEISKPQIEFSKKYYEKRNLYYNWNLKHIYICNARKVSEFLGINIEVGEERIDLLGKEECIDFIIKYNHYFKECNVSNFKEFTKETKLNLTNIYKLSSAMDKNATYVRNVPKDKLDIMMTYKPIDYITDISFNELGSSIDRDFNYELYNHDLLVINET